MVSNRCKLLVKDELKKMGLHFVVVDMCEVEIMEDLDAAQWDQLKLALAQSGLELMDDRKAQLVSRIKEAIIDLVYLSDDLIKINFSVFISSKLNQDYTFLANLFSSAQGTTIEQFIISHKVARIKDLLIFDHMSITDVAWKMNYSSVAHLSNQFRKVTGMSPSDFKRTNEAFHGLKAPGDKPGQQNKNK